MWIRAGIFFLEFSLPVAVSGFIGFYRVLSGLIGLSGFVGFLPVLSGFGGFYRALMGFRGLSWVSVFRWDLAPPRSLLGR